MCAYTVKHYAISDRMVCVSVFKAYMVLTLQHKTDLGGITSLSLLWIMWIGYVDYT